MEVQITKCDICGKKAETSDYDEPKGWYNLYRQGSRNKDFWAQRRDICDECALKLNLHLACERGDNIKQEINE